MSSSQRYCLPAIFISCWETDDSLMMPNQEHREEDQPIQCQSCATAGENKDFEARELFHFFLSVSL